MPQAKQRERKRESGQGREKGTIAIEKETELVTTNSKEITRYKSYKIENEFK